MKGYREKSHPKAAMESRNGKHNKKTVNLSAMIRPHKHSLVSFPVIIRLQALQQAPGQPDLPKLSALPDQR